MHAPPQITLHGIRNCDTVRKARDWFDTHQVAYRFHDFKTDGVPVDALDRWIEGLGWERLVNRQGLTWRRLDESVRAGVTDASTARALMLAQPSVIKRPVVEWSPGDDGLTVGFQASEWTTRIRKG